MSLWIKICANTSLQDAQLAAELGADALGFVLAPSKRRVTVEQVAAIVPQLPPEVEKIGVFVDAGLDEIAASVESSGLTGVQLHFEAHATLAGQLRNRFGAGLRIVRTVHFASGEPAPLLEAVDSDANIDSILVDSRTAIATGGTGQPYNWDIAAVTLFQVAEKPMIAAGGLTAENVARAIAVLKPWGVDVASGVEAVPGRKDPAKLRAFIENARTASGTRSGPNFRS
jgi:phosphoribosylanthranilate isomerase